MRRILSLLIGASLLAAACTGGRAISPPPVPETDPAPIHTSGPSTEPPTIPAGTPAASGLQAEPPGGLKELISKAPANTLTQIRLKAGQSVNRPGVYFMTVPGGEIEGWVLENDPAPWTPFTASPDSRWIQTGIGRTSYLADRQAPAAVYQWDSQTARLVAARGSTLLFATAGQFWLGPDGPERFTAIAIRPNQLPQAEIAPDGKALLLVNGSDIYRIGIPAGEIKQIGSVAAGEYVYGSLMPIRNGSGVAVITTITGVSNRPTTRVQRFDWSGRRLSDQTVPGTLRSFSPDGTLVTWRDRLLGGVDSPLVMAGASELDPKFRLVGEDLCTNIYSEGYPWMADGSGLVVSTTRGFRLLRTDGTLAELPALAAGSWRAIPVPAPDRSGRFAIDGTRVVDTAGKRLAEVVLGNGVQAGHITPWGETGDEVRFTPRYGGKGNSCGPTIFPPVVEKAPFAPVAGLQVKVAEGDCVNLRREPDRTAPVLRCLPNGHRLTASVPPGRNNKGWLDRYSNPMGTNMGGELWWHVRTETGLRGWVLLSSEYLTWAPPLAGAVADPVQDLITDEAENMLFWFRIALGEEPCSQMTCATGASLQESVWGLGEWCSHAGPVYIRKEPGFDPNRHGAGLQALENTCAAIRSAIDTTKNFDDTGAWTKTVTTIKNDLLRQIGR